MSVGAGENYYQFDEEFRNSIGTVDAQGKRVWVYAKNREGHFIRSARLFRSHSWHCFSSDHS